MEYIKKYWWIVIALLLLMPFFLNWLVTRDNILDYKVAGGPKDWLSFWVTYFSALTSLAMVLITWYTLNEMKRQWKESTRPYLFVSIKNRYLCQNVDESREKEIRNINEYLLVIENCGNSVANDVQIKFDKAFLDDIRYEEVKNSINKIMNNKIAIAPHGEYVIKICDSVNGFDPKKEKITYNEFQTFLDNFNNRKMTITLNYNGYKEDTNINTPKNLQRRPDGIVEELYYIRMSIDKLKKEIANLDKKPTTI